MARFFNRPRSLGQQTRGGSKNRNKLLLTEQVDVGRDDCAAQYPLDDRARRVCEVSLNQEVQSKNSVLRYLLVWGLVGIALIGFIIYLLVRE